MELRFEPNGKITKLLCRPDGERNWSSAKLGAALLEERSSEIRAELEDLSNYVRDTDDMREELDPGWREYLWHLTRIRQCGDALHAAMFDEADQRAAEMIARIERLPVGSELIVHCSEEDGTLPLGFTFSQQEPIAFTRPSISDFAGFWLTRFRITMLVDGGGCDRNDLAVPPNEFSELYALHQEDSDCTLIPGIKPPIRRICYTWADARSAYAEMAAYGSVVFILAHSNGDWLELSNSERMESVRFKRMLHSRRFPTPPVLVILNCCRSVAGPEQRSLLSCVARRGFCGLVGTEAGILNKHALRCGLRLIGQLEGGNSLGEAFDKMQYAPDLFPLNLLYTCYADREFRLGALAPQLTAA
ncbi:hypothetical protein [Caballeronia sp. Sq4a]|uniref:hypothetical protein n=1 Tax=Caballeronia sp. Sq4a TaxID=2878152 RepID=UPI0020BF5BAB|nr:hypothetical protein [Caballeronia sp. Sq4a]